MTTRLIAALTLLLALVACGTAPSPESSVDAAPADGDVVATGTFEGRSDHVVLGTVQLVDTGDGLVVVLGDDFDLDGAPDPRVGFGKGGEYGVSIAELASHEGAQNYPVPASVDVNAYDEVTIWCDDFSVPLGVAKLER